jgi:hypothetical protein
MLVKGGCAHDCPGTCIDLTSDGLTDVGGGSAMYGTRVDFPPVPG